MNPVAPAATATVSSVPSPDRDLRGGSRLASIDALRGLVMIVMALDHTRDYFSNGPTAPDDLSTTTPAYFFTRWITHFCAPVFVLLAGTAAFLHASRLNSRAQLSRFLALRGLSLILLEFTVVHFAWGFQLSFAFLIGQVIWAIGVGFLALALLIHLPTPWILTLGLALIAGHNATDAWNPTQPAWFSGLWSILHRPEPFPVGPVTFFPLYSLLPWIGVIAVGYGLGPLFTGPAPRRHRLLLLLGAGGILAFLVLRALNLYGDPQPWSVQSQPGFTLLSFLRCAKYPPSLLFLLMTLGPALLLLRTFERHPFLAPRWLLDFGRVPLFYYLTHLYLIHLLAGIVASIHGRPGHAAWVWNHLPFFDRPDGYGYSLAWVYLAWILVVVALYPACRWYAGVKAARRR